MIAIRELSGVYRTAYSDAAAILRGMWPVLLMLSAYFVTVVMGYFSVPLLVTTPIGKIILRMLLFCGFAYAAAPLYVALHRYVAYGETRWVPSRAEYGNAANIYTAYAALSILLWFTPIIAGETLSALGLDAAGILCVLFGLLAVWLVMVRLTTLLPMAALSPERAGWSPALSQSRHRFWFVFMASNGPSAPFAAVLMILYQAAHNETMTYLPWWIFSCLAMLGMQIIPLAVGTRLYQRFATTS